MKNISHDTYKSFGLVRSDAVEEHSKCTRQKATLTRRARHSEGLSTSGDPISKKQTCNNRTNRVSGNTTTKLLRPNTQILNVFFFLKPTQVLTILPLDQVRDERFGNMFKQLQLRY